MNNGRMCDVLIEEREDNNYWVWADDGNTDIIRSVKGVFQCMQIITTYSVSIDLRYDSEIVLKEIEAQIKINGVIKNE
jgi:hypothetical protein